MDPPSPNRCQGYPQTVAKLWTFRILLRTTTNSPKIKLQGTPRRSYTHVRTRPRLLEACLRWKVETPVALPAPASSWPCTAASPASPAPSTCLGHLPCPSACSHLLCLPVRVGGAPLSGHGPQPVWVLDPGASPPGLHAHQGDPGNRTRRDSWQMLTVGF